MSIVNCQLSIVKQLEKEKKNQILTQQEKHKQMYNNNNNIYQLLSGESLKKLLFTMLCYCSRQQPK